MSARRAGQKVFDWSKLSSSVPQEARAELAAFRARHEAARTACMSLPETPEPINWQYYQKNISKANFVDSFKKQFEAVSIPYPKDTTTEEVNKQEKEFESEALDVIKRSKLQAQELRKELEGILAQKSYQDMTIDEYLEDKPELRKQVEVDMKNHQWY